LGSAITVEFPEVNPVNNCPLDEEDKADSI